MDPPSPPLPPLASYSFQKSHILREQLHRSANLDEQIAAKERSELREELNKDMAELQDFKHDPPRTGKLFNVCQQDPSVSDGDKAKRYRCGIPLNSHLNSSFHSAMNALLRTALQRAKTIKDLFHCRYCTKANTSEAPFIASSITKPAQHIVNSNELNTNRVHDELKSADGWYELNVNDGARLLRSDVPEKQYWQHRKRKLAVVGGDAESAGEQIRDIQAYGDCNIVRKPNSLQLSH